VPLEGVVHALRNIHAALEPNGILVDTQPVSPRPSVSSNRKLGTLDMREWLETIRAVDERLAGAGLFELRHESHVVVTDGWESGAACLEELAGWDGTRVPPPLAARLAATSAAASVRQTVRVRLFEASSAPG